MKHLFARRVRYTGEHLIIDRRALVLAMVLFYLFAAGISSIADVLPSVVAVPPILFTLSFVPGLLLLLTVVRMERIGAKCVVYALGLSLFLLMLLGLAMNVLLPPLGIMRPLETGPLLVCITALVAVLGGSAYLRYRADKIKIFVGDPVSPAPLALALLPLLSILSISFLNWTGNNILLLITLTLVALVPIAVTLADVERWHSFGIWSTALAILYHESLAAGNTFPGNPVVVRTWTAARWEPGTFGGGPLSTELLQHGTIFPALANLGDVNIMTQMIIINPVFISFIPVALFVAFRQYVPSRFAFVGASIFAFAHPFYLQFPTAGRSGTPVIFLALFAVVLSESDFGYAARSGLSLAFLTGVVFTHYGTSYFVMVVLGGAVVSMLILRLMDRGMNFAQSIRFVRVVLKRKKPWSDDERSILSWSLAGFFIVSTFSWFLYTNDGRGFALFPRHASRSLGQFLTGAAGIDAGRTAARLQRDYEAPAIALSKTLYFSIALLIAIGLTVTLVRRFLRSEKYTLDDHFFVIGGLMLAIFGTTLIVRTWGGGRPMMIAFVFTLLFAVIGVAWLGDLLEAITDRQSRSEVLSAVSKDHLLTGFAVLVGVLLLLNTGVASATVLPGGAPVNVPANDGNSNFDLDMQTHAWLIDHREAGDVYGDNTAFVHTDGAAPAIAARTEDGRQYGPIRPRGEEDIRQLNISGAPPGYLLFLSHNVETSQFNFYLDKGPISIVRTEYKQNKIYTTGRSWIYKFGNISAQEGDR